MCKPQSSCHSKVHNHLSKEYLFKQPLKDLQQSEMSDDLTVILTQKEKSLV